MWMVTRIIIISKRTQALEWQLDPHLVIESPNDPIATSANETNAVVVVVVVVVVAVGTITTLNPTTVSATPMQTTARIDVAVDVVPVVVVPAKIPSAIATVEAVENGAANDTRATKQ